METTEPNYHGNFLERFAEHVGHGLHEAEHAVADDVIGTVRKVIKVDEAFAKQFPTIAADTATVAEDVFSMKALGVAVAAAVAGGGANLAADAGVLAALVTDGPTLIKLFSDAGALVKTVETDASADAKLL
jgi:hypothetical protein